MDALQIKNGGARVSALPSPISLSGLCCDAQQLGTPPHLYAIARRCLWPTLGELPRSAPLAWLRMRSRSGGYSASPRSLKKRLRLQMGGS